MDENYDDYMTLVAEKVAIVAQMNVSYAAVRRAKAGTIADPAARQLVTSIETYMWGNKIHRNVTGSVRFHASWWQGFKDSFFPDWLKRHYPVRYETRETSVTFQHVCPHLAIETRDGEKSHWRFLAGEGLLRRWDAS